MKAITLGKSFELYMETLNQCSVELLTESDEIKSLIKAKWTSEEIEYFLNSVDFKPSF